MILKKIISSLKKDSENFIKENVMLKKETLCLNERITVLNKDISSFKMKYEEILKNVTKFNQGKEKLNDLLSYQKMSHNHYGLGFLNQSEKSIHDSKKNHNLFVKRNTDIISKRIKNKFIWIPKNLSIVDKNTVYTNRWKPNSNWIWIPKG